MTCRARIRLPLLLLCAAGILALLVVLAEAGTASGGTRAARPAGARPAKRHRPCRPSRTHRRGHRSRCRHARRQPPPAKAHTRTPAPVGPPASGGIDGQPPIRSAGGPPGPPGAAQAPPEAGSPEPAPPSVPHVQVTAVEYGLTLSRSSVPAGKVVLEFVNRGQDEHNLNAAPLEGPLTASIANTASGAVVDETIEMRPGSYTLFCSLPEHEQKGMKATLVVH
jgi:plastocyanin